VLRTATQNEYAEFNALGLSLRVTGGTFKILASLPVTMVVNFTGNVGGVAGAESALMSGGSIALQHYTILKVSNGLVATGGRISTLSNGKYVNWATIEGNVWNAGADVIIFDGSTSRELLDGIPRFGRLKVVGDVEWTAGTYRPVTYAPRGSQDPAPSFTWHLTQYADHWECSGKFTIAATTPIIAPGAVDADGVLNAQQPFPATDWVVISGNTLAVTEPGPTIEGPWRFWVFPPGHLNWLAVRTP
jgi:hypothetical protein